VAAADAGGGLLPRTRQVAGLALALSRMAIAMAAE
jgi:hypothetical protein